MSFHLSPDFLSYHLPPPWRGFTWELPGEYEEKFFYCVGEQLPKEVVGSLSLEMVRTHLAVILCDLFWVNLLEQEGQMG